MREQIQQAAKKVRDTRAGWVTRRDAVQFLGDVAAESLAVLKEHAEEPDVDVRRVVDEALQQASAALAGIAPKTLNRTYSLEELVRPCEKPGSRTITPEDAGFMIDVRFKKGRSQRVHVSSFKSQDGRDMVRVMTQCGKGDDQAADWSLRANMKIPHGAVALTEIDGEETLVLVNCHPIIRVTPAEIKDDIKAIAFYGDWLEKKLTGQDDF
jgi:hypothetical protein